MNRFRKLIEEDFQTVYNVIKKMASVSMPDQTYRE